MIVKKFERAIVVTLLGLMVMTVALSTIELAIVMFEELLRPPFLLFDLTELLEVFGFFLVVLIGLELIESIKTYLRDDRVNAEVVILVALVAVSRKVVILDYSGLQPGVLYGMAALIIALGVGFFFVRKGLSCEFFGRTGLQAPKSDTTHPDASDDDRREV
ncbi:phosphate-starvation-inducible PsiE family protein [bacterium]|nr:phosphate-starvation-inducible PsiE family protein [candidate division CSSED10-310 bacterium]